MVGAQQAHGRLVGAEQRPRRQLHHASHGAAVHRHRVERRALAVAETLEPDFAVEVTIVHRQARADGDGLIGPTVEAVQHQRDVGPAANSIATERPSRDGTTANT